MRLTSALLMSAALLSIAPAALAETWTHAQGQTVIPATPKRVVVFDLGALDTLHALGVEAVAGVPGSAMPPALATYDGAAYTHVGTLFEPDYEAVKALAPDLIIIGGRSAKTYEALSAIAPTLDLSIGADDYIGGAIGNTRLLGRLFGKETRANELTRRLEASIAALKAKTAGGGTGLTLFTVNDRVVAHAAGARFGQIHKDFGVPQALTDGFDAKNLTRSVTFEEIAHADPDWIFVLDRGAATGGAPAAGPLLSDPLVAGTKAGRNGHIVRLDPVEWYIVGGGIRSLQGKVDQLLEAYGN